MKRSTLARAVRWFVATAMILPIWFESGRTAAAAIADCIDATCRIGTPDGGRGTGCVFELSQGQVYVLTAAHVVEKHPTVQCEFWHEGHQSKPLEGRVIARVADDQCDAAIVALGQTQFAGILPRVVPIAARDYTLSPGAAVTSVGCANGSWSSGWKGHVLGYQEGELRFVPAPANGRSGSAVFDANGERIVGLLRARTGDNSQGIATPVQGLYRAFEQKTAAVPGTFPRQSSLAQCPGGVCPTPAAPGSSAPQWRLLPYRFNEQFRNGQQPQPSPGPYPTLPAPNPGATPTAPPVDLAPVLDQLNRIARDLESQSAAPSAASPVAPPLPVAAVDEEARRKLADGLAIAGSAIEAVGKNATQGITEAKAEAADAKNAAKTAADTAAAAQKQALAVETEQRQLEGLVAKHGTLAEQWAAHKQDVEARLGENASRLKVDVQTMKDMVHDKAATLKEHGVIVLVALAVILGLLVWVIHHKIEAKLAAGKPLAVDAAAAALAGLATGNPAVAPVATVLSHLAETVGHLVRRVEATHNTADATLKAVSTQTTAQTAPKSP